MVEEGKKAPDFKLLDNEGQRVQLSKLKGGPVVIYFYPKDDTSGCTSQAKAFSENLDLFQKHDVQILGISPDSVSSHQKFIAKHNLKVRLLSDENKEAAGAYGVWVEKSMYGRKYMGVERSTFLVGANGKIVRIWRKVRVKGHIDDVLSVLPEETN